MKKRLKADSVDELFEIVKAVQNGEDPEEYAKRKREEERQKAEEAEKAAKRKREEERQRAEEAEKAARRKREEERAAEREAKARAVHDKNAARMSDTSGINPSDEELEQLLEDDPGEEFDSLKMMAQGIAERFKTAGSFLGEKSHGVQGLLTGWKESASEKVTSLRGKREAQTEESAAEQDASEEQKNAGKAPDGKPAAGVKPAASEELVTGTKSAASEEPVTGVKPAASEETAAGSELSAGGDRIRELGRVHLTDIEKEPVGKTRRRYGAKSVSEESETIGKRILHSLHMDSPGAEQEERAAADKRATADDSAAGDEIDTDSIDLDTVQILDRLLDAPAADSQTKADRPETAEEGGDTAEGTKTTAGTESAAKEKSAGAPAGIASPKPEENTDIADGAGSPENADQNENPQEETAVHDENTPIRKRIVSFSRKRMAVIGSAAAAVLLIVIVTACMLNRVSQLQEKQKYVTADEGLTITVENQPSEWCTSCELTMKVSVKGSAVSSIEIDGITVEPDEKGYVTAQVQGSPLEVTVTTEEGTLAASVEIPMLDADAPVVTADIYGGEITLTAADTRSGAAQIYYAVVEEDDWLQLPQYQQYSEPIAYEEDCIYYFYAVDQAGNSSVPVVSNMVSAESITLSETGLTLYPGETAYIEAEAAPSNALLTNLQYESSNTDVVTVSSSGQVTAIAEGSTLIKVTADGVDMVTCTVDVVTETVITVSAIGDCTLGTYKGSVTSTNFDTYYSMYGATWFFQNVKDILSNDDVTFANLEGPLTDATSAADKTYAFKGDPSYTEILQDGSVEVVTLANNHSSDYGSEGLSDTKENLTAAGIDYCTGDTIAYQDISGIRVAFIGIYELAAGLDCETQVRETIAEAQSEGAQLIIVAFHWGTEKENYPDETQQSLAHTAIDCGADLVVGHHPHVLQGIEKYNGKYIVYSLGNFCFGGNSNPSDKDTMIFRQTFTISADGVALDDDIEIIPCTLSSASDYNDYRPTPATGTAADEIMERINEYSSELGDITYTASTGL